MFQMIKNKLKIKLYILWLHVVIAYWRLANFCLDRTIKFLQE